MKRFMLELGGSIISGLVIVPVAFIGLCVGAWTYNEYVEPWLEKNLKKPDEKKEVE